MCVFVCVQALNGVIASIPSCTYIFSSHYEKERKKKHNLTEVFAQKINGFFNLCLMRMNVIIILDVSNKKNQKKKKKTNKTIVLRTQQVSRSQRCHDAIHDSSDTLHSTFKRQEVNK